MLLSLNIIYPLFEFKYISASHYFHASYHIYAEEFDVVTKVSLLWRRTVCGWRRGLLTTEGSDHVQRCTVLQDVYSTVQCTVQLRNVTGDDPLHTVSTPSLHHTEVMLILQTFAKFEVLQPWVGKAFSWFKAPTSDFKFKTLLLRH